MSEVDSGLGWARGGARRRPGKILQNLIAIAIVAGLLVFGRIQPQLGTIIVQTFLSYTDPWIEAIQWPIDSIKFLSTLHGNISDQQDRESEYRKGEIERQLWRDRALLLQEENRSLRTLLGMRPAGAVSQRAARIIADSGGPFVRTYLLDRGSEHGVQAGQAVLTSSGLIGRIISAGDQSSRALALTDVNSRIPIYFGESKKQALLIGDNSNEPALGFIPREDLTGIESGMKVRSSRIGGGLPDGLYIGRVRADGGGTFRVVLPNRAAQQDYVLIVDYGFEAFPEIE